MRNFIICTLHQIEEYKCDQIKTKEMDAAHSKQGRKGNL
jgi:hypothetical protein